MDFEDSQFQAAPSGGDGFDTFEPPVAVACELYGPPQPANGGLDDFFSGSGSAPAIPAAAAAEARQEDFGVVPAADAPPSIPIDEATLDTFTAAADAGDEDPFFQHYTPPAAAAPAPAPEVVDPRVEWRKQNNEQLKKKDVEESGSKQKLKDTAASYLSKYYEVRSTTLTTRKGNNRKAEAHQKEVEVPLSGTAWEKIHALVNLNSNNHHAKDVTRYKALLITCKAKNVGIRA